MELQKPQDPPRVLIFPLPIQGNVNSTLKLGELLALEGLHVTYLTTNHIHNRLLLYSNIQPRLSSYPGFLFNTISDGLPPDHRRSFAEVLFSMHATAKPLLREILVSDKFPSINCIISDAILGSFTNEIADELGIPIFHFCSISACCFWAYFPVPKLIETGELPVKGKEDMDRLIKGLPGMEGFLRCRDLPSFCQVSDTSDSHLQQLVQMTQHSARAKGIILNTFEDLEGPILSHIQTMCPKIYPIGPLHAHLKHRLNRKEEAAPPLKSSSIFKVDRSCLEWLDAQPSKSVIYISFGSIATTTKEELMEFWYGLVNSKKRFLWVIRPDLVTGEGVGDRIPVELSDGTRERGVIVEWAPQEEVIAHEAVGGFVTHSGWNSTLESIVAEVPMICWPYFADQQINSRYVGEVWKFGMDMKDVCDRKVVEKMVNDLMVERREEFVRSTAVMAALARKSVSEGGSSYCNFDRLVKDIKVASIVNIK
ncbi:hypothetical protein UlMin_024224 [Ulmus minor]